MGRSAGGTNQFLAIRPLPMGLRGRLGWFDCLTVGREDRRFRF